MPAPQTASLPPEIALSAGCVIRFRAVNATSGADVGGVTLQDAAIEIRQLAGSAGALASGPFMLVPGPNA